jgi:hypothetical protein
MLNLKFVLYIPFEHLMGSMFQCGVQKQSHGSCSFLVSKFKAFLRLFKASQGQI